MTSTRQGEAKKLKNVAEKLLSYKGVKHGKLTMTASLKRNKYRHKSL